MDNISNYIKCSNCGACYNVCPVDAIEVIKDTLFYEVNVDETKCINCGLCKKVCPINNSQQVHNFIDAYGGEYKNKEVVKNSSSGGAFTAIYEYVLSKGGVVYGACFNDDFKSVSIKSSEDININQMRKSKYVESQVEFSFRSVKNQLEKGRIVLYSAAPCQIAGLKKFLQKDYENLYTCDFICGGFPSHNIYENYIETLEKKYKSKAKSVDFRSKFFGWQTHYLKVVFKNKKVSLGEYAVDPYFYGFVGKYYTIRDYCYECTFNKNHYSDITLADFWRYKELSDFPYNNDGLSMLLINSKKGEFLIKSIEKTFSMKKIDVEGAKKYIKCHNFSKEYFEKRNEFLDYYKEKGIFLAGKKYYNPALVTKIKAVIKNIKGKL